MRDYGLTRDEAMDLTKKQAPTVYELLTGGSLSMSNPC